jgi:hypothetical protein
MIRKALFIGLLFAGGCGILDPDSHVQERLRNERDAWLAKNIKSYTYEFNVACFCPISGLLLIRVENDQPVSVIRESTGEAVAFTAADPYTITRLFDYLIQRTGNADEVELSYDQTYHFPSRVGIDYERNAIDDEWGAEITNFAVISP